MSTNDNFNKSIKKATELIFKIKYKINWFNTFSALSIEHKKHLNFLDINVYYEIMWDMLILEICKLYNTNKNHEKSSFFILFTYVKDNYNNLNIEIFSSMK